MDITVCSYNNSSCGRICLARHAYAARQPGDWSLHVIRPQYAHRNPGHYYQARHSNYRSGVTFFVVIIPTVSLSVPPYLGTNLFAVVGEQLFPQIASWSELPRCLFWHVDRNMHTPARCCRSYMILLLKRLTTSSGFTVQASLIFLEHQTRFSMSVSL